MAIAGWYRDPTGQGDARYWDGQRWTDSVILGGQTVSVPTDAARATVPPAPGTEYTSPARQQPAGQSVTVSSGGGGGGLSVGAVVAAIAIVIAVIALIVALTRNGDSGDDGPTTTEPPATEAPDTEAPAEEE